MAGTFHFEEVVDFDTARAEEILRGIPALPGVFALYGAREGDEPYLTRTADLRRRIQRILAPPESQSKRLNLREKVARIGYCVTGSEFESALVLYDATAAQFAHEKARKRLRLHTPFLVRFAMENAHPRAYVTNRISRRALDNLYGPFPSRAAAERYCDAVLDHFKLRRCYEELEPFAEHPGCAYGEMKKCLRPCQLGCSADEYAAEAAAVKAFFDTHGESMMAAIAAQREAASADMDFEKAAALHTQWQKVKATAALADEIVRPVLKLRALIVQPAAKAVDGGMDVSLFLVKGGCVVGPERISTLGIRHAKEQTSVGSSLFAQPLMLQAVPLEMEGAVVEIETPEVRLAAAIARLEAKAGDAIPDTAMLSDHLSLLRRWYYRPEKQRKGEAFFDDGTWPVRRIMNGLARVVRGESAAVVETAAPMEIDGEAVKMKMLHAGREGVERPVAVIPRRKGTRKPR